MKWTGLPVRSFICRVLIIRLARALVLTRGVARIVRVRSEHTITASPTSRVCSFSSKSVRAIVISCARMGSFPTSFLYRLEASFRILPDGFAMMKAMPIESSHSLEATLRRQCFSTRLGAAFALSAFALREGGHRVAERPGTQLNRVRHLFSGALLSVSGTSADQCL